jgi:hypothetical protein
LNPSCNTVGPPGPNCVTPDDATIAARVSQELQGTGFLVPPGAIRVTPDQATRVSYFNGATPTSQYPITVSASFKFSFITPIIAQLVGDANGQLTINTSSVFRSEY